MREGGAAAVRHFRESWKWYPVQCSANLCTHHTQLAPLSQQGGSFLKSLYYLRLWRHKRHPTRLLRTFYQGKSVSITEELMNCSQGFRPIAPGWIWNLLKDKLRGAPVRGCLDEVIWSRKTNPKYRQCLPMAVQIQGHQRGKLCVWGHCPCVPLASSPTLLAMFTCSAISAATAPICSFQLLWLSYSEQRPVSPLESPTPSATGCDCWGIQPQGLRLSNVKRATIVRLLEHM